MALAMMPPSGGTLSPYLAGFWQAYVGAPDDATPLMLKIESTVILMNPTSGELRYKAVVFNTGGGVEACREASVGANATDLFRIGQDVSDFLGMVKIVSLSQAAATSGRGALRPRPGLVGHVRRIFSHGANNLPFGPKEGVWQEYQRLEMPLWQIPNEALADGELAILMSACT